VRRISRRFAAEPASPGIAPHALRRMCASVQTTERYLGTKLAHASNDAIRLRIAI
jgi:hypothetical protein